MRFRVDYQYNGHTYVVFFRIPEAHQIKTFLTKQALDKTNPLTLMDSICIFKLMEQELCTRSA